ncbi:hypothetical protein V2A60_002708 [Cordyceps javanica]
MARKKVLLLAPTMRSAPTGPIALGNIIKDPLCPELPLTDTNSAAVKLLADKHQDVIETNVFNSDLRASSVSGGVVAKFLEGLAGFGLDLGGSQGQSARSSVKIDRLVTQSITPTMEEVRSVFNEPSVQAGIRNSFFRANVYMITSVQLAYGAEDFITAFRKKGTHFHLRADLSPALLPVKNGADGVLDASDSTIQKSTIDSSTPFVRAYRLREILYRRRRVETQREYVNGDLYDLDDSREEKPFHEDHDPESSVAELVLLDDEDANLAELWDMKPRQYMLIDSGGEESDADDDIGESESESEEDSGPAKLALEGDASERLT